MNIRLVDAKVCADCNTIYSEEVTKDCPKCGSRQSFRVDRYIKPV